MGPGPSPMPIGTHLAKTHEKVGTADVGVLACAIDVHAAFLQITLETMATNPSLRHDLAFMGIAINDATIISLPPPGYRRDTSQQLVNLRCWWMQGSRLLTGGKPSQPGQPGDERSSRTKLK